jgi:hypothetical protein
MAKQEPKKGAITTQRKTDRNPLPSGSNMSIAVLDHNSTVTVGWKPPVNHLLNKTNITSPPSMFNTTTSTNSMHDLISSFSGTPLEPLLKLVCEFVDLNRGAYDDLMRHQKNSIQNYVVGEREQMEKISSDWIDEVERQLIYFIREETAGNHSKTLSPDSTNALGAPPGVRPGTPPGSESPKRIKLEPREDYVSYDTDWTSQNASSTDHHKGQNHSNPYTTPGYSKANLPQDLEERVRITTSTLLQMMQRKLLERKKIVTNRFSRFSNAGSKEHAKVADEQDRKLYSLVQMLVKYQVRELPLLLSLLVILANVF